MRITYDFALDTWDVLRSGINKAVINNIKEVLWTDLEISFRNNGSQNVEFDNLSYGYDITYKDVSLKSDRWPELQSGIKILSSDQEVMQFIRFEEFIPGEVYVIKYWVENAGILKEYNDIFKVPGYAIN